MAATIRSGDRPVSSTEVPVVVVELLEVVEMMDEVVFEDEDVVFVVLVACDPTLMFSIRSVTYAILSL